MYPVPARRGRRCLLVVAALAAASAATVVLGPGRPQPLPTLRNDAHWRAGLASDAGWLGAGDLPAGLERRGVVEQALLDLHGLTRANGAVAAGPKGPWAYAWPRDNSFVAVAYAVSGHPDDAWRVLEFFVGGQLPDGGFQARYTLDGAGPPDQRPPQSDGAGWLLWALNRVRTITGEPVPGPLRALRDRAARHLLDLTDDGTSLPRASPDYWEVPERRVTLGTVAPIAAGLEGAAATYAAEGSAARARRCADAAAALRARIRQQFGPRYERHRDGGGLDAGAVMLLPPFAGAADPAVVAAARAYAHRAGRPGGGLAPGVLWKSDGVSWTPETALVAYTAAASGDDVTAERWLGWLAAHRTTWGSLPEKVLPDGRPAGPAPLAWTAAIFVLTDHELAVRRATKG